MSGVNGIADERVRGKNENKNERGRGRNKGIVRTSGDHPRCRLSEAARLNRPIWQFYISNC